MKVVRLDFIGKLETRFLDSPTSLCAMQCTEYEELQREVQNVLEALSHLAEAQLTAFRKTDQSLVMRYDKELETMVGHKERMLGALRQHVKDHGCQPHLEHVNS